MKYIHKLELVMQEIFVSLLDHNETMSLRVDSLLWDQTSYTNCLQLLNLPTLSHVYEMVKHYEELGSMCDDVRSLPIDQLPFELIEMILIQATGHLFVTINRTTPARAEAYTLATMWAVSHLWWKALSHRKYIKRLLKRSFKRVCQPFEFSPQHMTSLHMEGGKNVWGVVVLNDERYVARGESNIQVFDSRPPFSRQEDINVLGMKSASDITVQQVESTLYR